jgi:hypothetical protein
MVSDEEDIRQSLMLLLSTIPGERPMKPEYGCVLHSILFDPIRTASPFMIRDAIETAILYFEPRIKVDDVKLDLSREREGRIDVEVQYTVRSRNVRYNIVFPFYKIEGTLLDDENRI